MMEEYGVTSVLLPGYTNADGETEWKSPTQEEIDIMDTPFLARALHLWVTTKRLGTPNGHGWNNERATVVEIYNILENENNRYESWAFENRELLDGK